MMDKLLTKAQVCEILLISSATLDRIVADGELPVLRVRGQIRYQESELLSYMGRCKETKADRLAASRPAQSAKTPGKPGRPRGSGKARPTHYIPGMKVV